MRAMSALAAIAFFLIGAATASFIGVIAARFNTGESVVTGRSRCDACSAPLPARALLPIFSFLVSSGRSSCCGTRLSLVDPLSEFLLGSLFALSYWKIGFSYALPALLVTLSVLLALVLYDLAHQMLPPTLLGAFLASASLAGFLIEPHSFPRALTIAFLIALFLAGIYALSRGRAMGLADAPFAFGCAILVGSSALPGFVFSFWIGAIVGIPLLLGRPTGSRMGIEVPFAPFLAAGFLLAYFTQWNPFVFIAALL